MNRLLLVLLALGAVVLGVVWSGVSAREARAPAPSGAGSPASAAPASPTLPLAVALEPGSGAEEAPAEPDVAHQADPARQKVESAFEEELARGRWVEGRVRFPPGTPADEELFVVADGRDFEHGADHRVQVERDGSFRVAFSQKTRSGWLGHEGRYLYLEERLRWKRADAAGPIVLAPELGGRVAGRLLPPKNVAPRAVGGQVELGDDRGERTSRRFVEVGAELVFAFGGLASERDYHVSYDGEALVATPVELQIEAGKTRTLDLELYQGVELSGRTLDEAGQPLPGVQVRTFQPEGLWGSIGRRMAESSDDGSFRFRGLSPGTVQLVASRKGYRDAQRDLGALEAGETRPGLELVLARGHQIAGRVIWPDGSPAEATVTVESETKPWAWSGPEQGEPSAADGTFRISGLPEGSFRLEARATKTEEVLVPSEGTGHERKKKQRTRFKALAEHVPAGTGDLVLTLSAGLELSGRVVDDLGASVAEFRVTAERRSTRSGWTPEGTVTRSFRDADGAFVLPGLVPGEWELQAGGEGYGLSEPLRVSVPDGEPPLLVLPREARVRGVVLDPSGAPVAGAHVLDEQNVASIFTVHAVDETGKTDARGAFTLGGLSPGALELVAEGSGWAPSTPLVLELAAGQEVGDLVLQLRVGGTITGEVLGSSGGGEVFVASLSFEFYEGFPLDAEGRFEARGVPPGEVQVSLETEGWLELTQEVSVAAGETVHVRFAPEELRRVRLHGRVLAGGEPLVGASVSATTMSTTSFGHYPGETDAAGVYELTLPGAGSYQLDVDWEGGSTVSWSTEVAVPEGASFACDVAIPVGRISGRVTLEGGPALAGLPVEARAWDGDGPRGLGHGRTDDDGRYELLVPAGTHTVTSGGNTWEARQSGRSLAAASVEGVVVADGSHVRGIDLMLRAGGTLEGVVRLADGSLAGEVILWSQVEGQAPRSLGWSEGGRFRILGVSPGAQLVGASSATRAARRWVPVEIEPGTVQHVELELVPATRLLLRVVDGSGAPAEAEVELRGADGRTYGTQTVQDETYSAEPLLAGSYTVRARRGEHTAERTFQVSGSEGQLELELVLPLDPGDVTPRRAGPPQPRRKRRRQPRAAEVRRAGRPRSTSR